jgi:hypothetical protein
MKPTFSTSIHRMNCILDILLDQDLDQKQLTDRLCMQDPRAVAKYVDHLRSEQKVHICGWRPAKVNGHRWPVYRFGKGQNKRKPKPKTPAQLMREYWTRKGKGHRDPVPVACPFGVLFKLQEQRA